MAESKPQFANFGQAFCAYYRVKPAKYGRAVLWRSLPWSRRLLALPILAFNRTFFATDLDIIRNLEASQSAEEFSLQLDELYAVNRIERNIRRGFLGIRASGSKLMNLWKTVEPYVAPPNDLTGTVASPLAVARSPGPAQATARLSPAIARRVGRAPSSASSESPEFVDYGDTGRAPASEASGLILRRIQRACDEVVSGTPVEEAVSRSGLDNVPQFLRLLAENATSKPSFRWLHEQLSQAERNRQIAAENAELKRTLNQQSIELARLRETHHR